MAYGSVVVAHTHEGLRAALGELLSECFSEVRCAADGEALLHALSQRAPDLVVLDVRLRAADRSLAAARLRDDWPLVPFIALCPDSDELPALMAACFGAAASVQASRAGTDLLPAVAEALEH